MLSRLALFGFKPPRTTPMVLVGRFGAGPPRMLKFCHDGAPDARFDGVYPLDFRAFVDAVGPGLVEVQRRAALPGVPTDLLVWSALETPARHPTAPVQRVTPESYLFVRAATHSLQAEIPSTDADDLFGGADEARRGAGSLAWFRQTLARYTGFHAHAHELVHALMLALEAASGLPIPAYKPGGPLPGGLAERVAALVLDARDDARIDLDGVDFDVPNSAWGAVNREPSTRANLGSVLHALRDVLTGRPSQHDQAKVYHRPLGDVIAEAIHACPSLGDPFLERFRKARADRAALRDFLGNKLQLGFLLHHVFSAFKQIPEARALANDPNKARQYAAMERVIRTGSNEVARPVRRPAPDERRRFEADLEKGTAGLLDAMAAPEDHAEAAIARLPGELRELAERLRADPERVRAARMIVGLDEGDPRRARMSRRLHILITDVLAPALYRAPELSYGELVGLVGSELEALFFVAAGLREEDVAPVRLLGRAWSERLESCVDEAGRLGTERAAVAGGVIEGLVANLVSAASVDRIADAQAQADEAAVLVGLDAMAAAQGTTSALALPLIPTPGDAVRAMLVDAARVTPADPVRANAHARSLAPLIAARGAGAPEDEGDTPKVIRRLVVHADGTVGDEEPPTRRHSRAGGEDGDGGRPPGARPGGLPDEPLALALRSVGALAAGGGDGASRALAAHPRFRAAIQQAAVTTSQAHASIYEVYAGPTGGDLPLYRRQVERLVLAEMILGMRAELGLGEKGSYLLRMLLDIVECTDASSPDLALFLRTHSLMEYIDLFAFAGPFLAQVEQLVEAGVSGMTGVAAWMSELRGVEHLFRRAADLPGAEIYHFTGNADELTKWLAADNFMPGGKHRLLVGQPDRLRPALLLMSDAAFADPADKVRWLTQTLSPAGYRSHFAPDGMGQVLLPPVLVSAGGSMYAPDWHREPEQLEQATKGLALPVHVLAASPALNPHDDAFPTTIPAMYLLAAHRLGARGQRFANQGLRRPSIGRLHIIGSGAAAMDESLERVVWGGERSVEGSPAVPLAVDEYLAKVLDIVTSATAVGPVEGYAPSSLYDYVFRSANGFNDEAYRQSTPLGVMLPGRGVLSSEEVAHTLALTADPRNPGRRSVRLTGHPRTMFDRAGGVEVDAIDWFDRLRGVLRV